MVRRDIIHVSNHYESISPVVLARSATVGFMWESNSVPC